MVAIPGSETLSSIFHVVAQSLLLPVIAVLLAFLIYSIVQAGGLLSEYTSRIRTDVNEIENIIDGISTSNSFEEIKEVVDKSNIPLSHKEVLIKIASQKNMGEKSREAFARKLIEAEEIRAAKSLEKTDIVAKIAPAIGLMGTLIPMGPGLAALGAGDINTLSQNLLIAFDSAILGMASAAIAFTISRIRRRWYEEQLSTLDSIAESLLEVMSNVEKIQAKVAIC
nr:MotA/TolQ/ExbB proton channel family protein [uncultured Methanobacterium sp.]